MRFIGRAILALCLFLGFLVWRFPYDALVERSVRNLEASTGAHLSYTPVSAGPFGVKFSEVKLTLPSGATLNFTSTRFYPIWGGIKAQLRQEDGEAELSLAEGVATIKLTNVLVDTHSSVIGVTRLTGDLTYLLSSRDGKGHLRMVVKEFAALPVEGPLELGSSFTLQNLGRGDQTQVQAQLNLVSQDGTFTADGQVALDAQPDGSPFINGQLRFDHPLRRGILILGGRWDDLQTQVVPQ